VLLDGLEAHMSALSTWEKGFVQDQIKRFDEHGAKVFMSPKQWAVLDKIYKEKVDDRGTD
jgi:hypothetical protein